MKLRGMVAVMLLCAASMCAQSAPATGDTGKPADHAACKRDKDGKMECCKKNKDGKMSDCCKNGKCAREKKESEKKT